jgi:hypothetical protein
MATAPGGGGGVGGGVCSLEAEALASGPAVAGVLTPSSEVAMAVAATVSREAATPAAGPPGDDCGGGEGRGAPLASDPVMQAADPVETTAAAPRCGRVGGPGAGVPGPMWPSKVGRGRVADRMGERY